MNLHRAALLLAFALGACADTSPDDADSEPACAGDCALTWSNGPALPAARDHHVSFIAVTGGEPTLYVAGGIHEGSHATSLLADVQGATLRADGTLAPWTERGALPGRPSGSGLAQTETHVYLLGGVGDAGGSHAEVLGQTLVAAADEGGALGEWRRGPTLPVPVFHSSAVIVGDSLYVVGGAVEMANPPVPTDVVARARLAPDGALGAFEELLPLPQPRSHHALVALDGALLVLGGITGSEFHASILRGALDADGALLAWSDAGALPQPLATHAAMVRGGEVWISGGVNLDGLSSSVVRAALTGDVFGEWRAETPMPVARSHVHQMPQWGRCLYSTAGGDHTGLHIEQFANVFIGCR